MSEEFKIPPDLAVFESQLRALPVSNSGIDRDELLYQAGWSAALASETPARRISASWFWPATSSTLATVAAVLAIVVFQQREDLHDRSSDAVVGTPVDSTRLDTGHESIEPVNRSLFTSPWLRRDFESRMVNAPLTTSSYRFELPTETTAVLDIEFDAKAPKSTFELLREMVPRTERKSRRGDRKPVWDWFSRKVGEII